MPRHLLPVLLGLLAVLPGPLHALSQQDPLSASTKTVNVELILDASGSMAEVLPEGETRMDAAKRILRGVIEGLPERQGINVGLRVYGHLGDNTEASKTVSCRASELLVPVAGLDKAALIQQVEVIQPTGWTPIAYALEQAAADFQPGGESITNAIVLVTDGEETCDPPQQSCDAAGALHQSDVSITTHVVGFALNPQQTELVRCIAEQGGGQLFGADDAAELGTAIGSALEGVGVSITPVAIPATAPAVPPAAPAVPLAEIRTLAYHQLTQWTTAVNDRGEEAPILSDDGQRIAFARAPGTADPATPNRIFVMHADGTGEQEVDSYPSLCGCGSLIDLSADGARIISSDSVQLRIAEASGGSGRELLALDSNELNAVRISGDGSTVVFRIYRDTTVRNTSPSQPIERGVYAVNADGSGLRQLAGPTQMAPLLGVAPADVPFFSAMSGADISTNGGQIVFGTLIAPAAGGEGQGLFAVNSDGSGLHQLLGRVSFVTASALSGDGRQVAYVTLAGGSGLQETGVLGFDGGGQHPLTDSTSLHPGTGANLPSGERIQLSQDGSRLLLGSTGLLYDTATGEVLALGIGTLGFPGDRTPLVSDGLFRATMDAGATRALYLFQPSAEPPQLARVDLDPADLAGAPAITDASVTPAYVLTEGRSTATVSARISPLEPVPWVGLRVLRAGLPDDNTTTSYRGPLLDDGTAGDTSANDGLFTNTTLATDCCAEMGPRTVRLKAETQAADRRRHATAIDVSPFQVSTNPVEGGPPPATPSTPPVTPVGPLPLTPPTAGDAAALATIAAQATRIAELEASSGSTPPGVITPPGDLITPTAPPIDVGASPSAGAATDQDTAAAANAAFITPDSTECTVTPRTLDALQALAATPDVAAADALLAAMAVPGLDLPMGQPADTATVAAITATYRQMTACFNAGNDLAAYALWTDDALRQIQAPPPTSTMPTPVPESDRSAFGVTKVQMLPDGRVVAVWEERGRVRTTTFAQALVRQDDRYVVSETLDAELE